MVVNDEPSRLVPRGGHVDRDLDIIVRKCLEKDPLKRYQSAELLGAELRRWLRGKPITARAIGPAERMWKWMRRNRLLTSFLFVSMVLSLIAVVGIESQRRLYRDERGRFLDQLIEAKLQQASRDLDARPLGRALARYADILRVDPNHRIARAVITEQLNNGVYAQPVIPSIETGIEINSISGQLAVSQDRNVVMVVDPARRQALVINDVEGTQKWVNFGKKIQPEWTDGCNFL